jgi:hypothetical protein
MGFLDFFKSKWKISNVIGLRIFFVLFFSFLSILLVILIVTWTPRSVYILIDELVAKCNAGDKDACGKLADIAKNDKADWMREYAVKKLANQVLLAEIGLNHREEDSVRAEAVKNPNLTDQEVLTEIAKNDEDEWVRKYAADKLEDKSLAQTVYAEIVKNYEYDDLRSSAASRLTDQILLADTARKDKSSLVRMTAADKLKDRNLAQSVYIDVAKNGKEKWARSEAVKRLADLLLLAEFAKNDKNRDVRLAAVENSHFIDQNLLGYIAKNDKDGWLRSRAAKKITDQTLLSDIAKNDKDSWVRRSAKDRLIELRRK